MSNTQIKQFPSNKHSYLTQEGLDNLRTKLDSLRKERFKICNRLRKMDAKEKTDYILTTNEITMLELNEREVARISDVLQYATVISKNEKQSDVKVGSTVKLRFGKHDVEYTLVDPIEVDPSAHKISEKSPLGRALIGKKAHEYISFVAPKGTVYKYKLDFIA